MALLIISDRDPQAWLAALTSKNPQLEVRIYPETGNPREIEYVLVWNHPRGVFNEFPNLKVIASMGAGVDHILSDPDLPEKVQVTRIVDTQLADDMAEFVLALVLAHLRNLWEHKEAEDLEVWKPRRYLRIDDLKVGIMGMGKLGTKVAEKLSAAGFKVIGWARTRQSSRYPLYSGAEQRDAFLMESNILVCLLPLTPSTENILNRDLFSRLARNAFIINVARGRHLVEEDLLEQLDNGHLSGAALDVFRQEPLPKEHPFWKHPKVHVTPHIASVTNPAAVAGQVLENYQRMQNGEDLINTVKVEQGY